MTITAYINNLISFINENYDTTTIGTFVPGHCVHPLHIHMVMISGL
jgi:hypothetical protein